MANNSDGSIVLSVQVDKDELKSEVSKLKKQLEDTFKSFKNISGNAKSINNELSKSAELQKEINSESNKQLIISEELKQAEAKTVQEQQKGLQEIANTEIAQERLTQSKLNSLKANNDLAISEEKVTQSINNTAISYEKVKQSAVGTETSNERLTQSINNSIISSEKLKDIDGAIEQSDVRRAQAQENISSIVSEASQKYDDVLQTINETVENADDLTKSQQELQQAVNETAVSYEKIEQAVYNTAIAQEKLKQAVNETDVSGEKRQQAISKTLQEQQKELIYEEKLKQEKEKTKQAQEKTKQEQEKTTREVKKTEDAQKSLKNKTLSVAKAFGKMASALGIAFSVGAIINFSKEAGELASSTEANLIRLNTLYGESSKEVYDWIDANASALGMAKTSAYEAAASYGNLFTTFADSQQSAELSTDMLKATAVVASQTGRTYEKVFEKIQSGIYGNTRAIDDLGISVRQSSLEQTQAWQTVSQNGTKSWNDLTDAELQQLRVLGIIEQAQTKYGDEVIQSTALVRSKFNAAWTDFKETWGQVVNVVLIPLLDALTTVINAITIGLKSVAKMLGVSKENEIISSGVKDNSKDTAKNQKEITKETKKTNKELNRSLMSFDKINKLSEAKSDTSGGDGGEEELPTTTGGGGGTNYLYETSETVQTILGVLMGVAGAALLAIGLILLVSGHIIWGIGAIIAGLGLIGVSAATLSKAFNEEDAESILGVIGAVTSIVLITLGVVLLAIGQIPWGVAAIIAGIIAGGVTKQKLGEKLKSKTVSKIIQDIAAVAAGGLAALGVIFLAFGQIPWGIALIIAGIAIFAVSVFATEEGGMKQKIKTFLKGLLKVVGSAMLILGIIMCCFGIISPISIALIIAGAALLITGIALDFDAVKKKVSTVWESIKKFCKGWGFLILGIILTCVGLFAFGIPLIKKGATNLTESESPTWSKLREKLSTVKEAISKAWKGWGKLILGLILCCTGLFIVGVPLVKQGAQYLTESESPTWSKLREKLGDVRDKIKEKWQGWGKLILGLILCCTGFFAVGIPLVKQGAQHLTTSKDPLWTSLTGKLKDVWESIKKFWDDNIAEWFTVEKWKELAGNIANGLKSKLKTGINSIIGFFETMINRVIEKFNKISFDVPDWVPKIGGKTYGINISEVKIPRLAKGAVIPANREFLAVLGDQKSGTNIEAPAKLIKQMTIEAIRESNLGGKDSAVIEVPVYLDGDVLFRAVVSQNKKYKKALGVSPLGV